jgi:hypothetical protein
MFILGMILTHVVLGLTAGLGGKWVAGRGFPSRVSMGGVNGVDMLTPAWCQPNFLICAAGALSRGCPPRCY